MYVIVSGEVRIVVNKVGQPEKEIVLGDVRVLYIDPLNFESPLRERPEVSLAVMRELCKRLKGRG